MLTGGNGCLGSGRVGFRLGSLPKVAAYLVRVVLGGLLAGVGESRRVGEERERQGETGRDRERENMCQYGQWAGQVQSVVRTYCRPMTVVKPCPQCWQLYLKPPGELGTRVHTLPLT